MSKLPSVTGKQVITALEKLGFMVQRQKVSHVRLKDQNGRVVTVPNHANKTLGKGLLLKILKDAELSKEEFIDLLN
jgi:predicted RNA binding protein YcfA (HicA-like mRNA interferase family)